MENGSVKGLKARGGVEVSLKWENGLLKQVEIFSQKHIVVALKYGNVQKTIPVKKGEKLIFNKDLILQ